MNEFRQHNTASRLLRRILTPVRFEEWEIGFKGERAATQMREQMCLKGYSGLPDPRRTLVDTEKERLCFGTKENLLGGSSSKSNENLIFIVATAKIRLCIIHSVKPGKPLPFSPYMTLSKTKH